MPSSPRPWSCLALATALLAACSTTPELPKPPPPPRVLQAPGHKVLILTDADAGASVVLEPAQMLMVRLPIGASAGLEWALADMKPGVVSVTSSKFERALRNNTNDDASGASVWQFKPDAAGTIALTFELRRTKTLLPAVQTVTYSVTVK